MKNTTALPTAIIPFILANLEGFDAVLEDGERIIITPKNGAVVKRPSRALTAVTAPAAIPAPAKPILRPKFIYTIRDRHLTPQQAKRYGFSEQRLRVYQAIFDAPKGLQSKDILEQTKLPHGTVQQILHWLRKQNMISGTPESAE